MMRTMFRFPVLLALLAAGSLFGAGCGGGGSSNPGGKDGTGTPLGKADFSLTSAEYLQEVQKDAKAAEAKYKDKVIELTGPLASINLNASGEGVFSLHGPDPKKPEFVMCGMVGSKPWTKGAPGQTVKLKGKAFSFGAFPMLSHCEVEEAKGDGPPKLTADELAKEYAADPAAAGQKYNNKWIILSGEVEKIDEKDGVVFKTKEKTPQVSARFTPDVYKLVSSWKPGQKVSVLGDYGFTNLSKDKVALITPLPLDDAK